MNVRVVKSLAALVIELRPDLPPVLATSFVVETIDRVDEPTVAELDPTRRWAEARENMYPAAQLVTRRALARMRRTAA